jgi:formylmethanofuran dehydrogenase subunit E
MKTKFLLPTLFAIVVAGCAPAEKAAETSTNNPSVSSPTSPTAEIGKCEGCGAEVANTKLESHEGQMMCEACIAAHNH